MTAAGVEGGGTSTCGRWHRTPAARMLRLRAAGKGPIGVREEAAGRGTAGGESGQMMVFLIGLVVLVLMVLGLGWDASNWFLGHRALNNLADGAAIAAASEVDLRVLYASDGRRIELGEEQATATVRRYLTDAAGDSGIDGVWVAEVRVERGAGRQSPLGQGLGSEGPTVTVELRAVAPVAFLRLLHLVAPVITGRATATAEVLS